MELNALTSPAVWLAVIIILVLHLVSAIAAKNHAGTAFILTAVDVLAHLVFIAMLMFLRATPEELFFVLLLSAFTAMIFTGLRKRGEGK